MASVRRLKKDIDYLIGEVLSDCYLAIYFHPENKTDVLNIMNKAAEMRNKLICQANTPVEKNNASLVRKHYAQIHRDIINGVDELFSALSKLCK